VSIRFEEARGLSRTCQCCLSQEGARRLVFEHPAGSFATVIVLCGDCCAELERVVVAEKKGPTL
jgi:hypothetical protein